MLLMASPDCESDLQLGEQHHESSPMGFTTVSKRPAGITYEFGYSSLLCIPVCFISSITSLLQLEKKTQGVLFPRWLHVRRVLIIPTTAANAIIEGLQLQQSNTRKPEKRHKQ